MLTTPRRPRPPVDAISGATTAGTGGQGITKVFHFLHHDDSGSGFAFFILILFLFQFYPFLVPFNCWLLVASVTVCL